MTEKLQIYECQSCGNVVQILRAGAGSLVCCDQPMQLLGENTTDAAQEKHVPVIEKIDDGFMVTIGSAPHPMEDDHYIEWIELIADGRSYRKFLKPGDQPQASFAIKGESVTAREHCNKHGLWKADV